MKILVDVSLSPDWVPVLRAAGIECLHWSSIGSLRAPDVELMHWAREHGHWVLTHDLDFGAILAATDARAPSVLQLRGHDVLPAHVARTLLSAIEEYRDLLDAGALISIDEGAARARILPLFRQD